MSDSLWPHGLYSPWTSPGQNTVGGSLSLIQGIFPIQGLNPGLLHGGWILYQLSYQGSLRLWGWVAYLFSRVSSWPTSLVAQTVKHLTTMQETRFYHWVGKILQRRKWQPTPVFILAWKIPWEEPGRLQSMGSQRVGHDWVTLLISRWRNGTRGSCIAGRFFTNWAIREAKNLTTVVCFLLPLKREIKNVWHL